MTLTAREGHASVTDGGLVALREACYVPVSLRSFRRKLHQADVGLRLAKGDVLAQTAAEKDGLLRHDRDMPAKASQVNVAHVTTVDENPPGCCVVEAGDEPSQRALA